MPIEKEIKWRKCKWIGHVLRCLAEDQSIERQSSSSRHSFWHSESVLKRYVLKYITTPDLGIFLQYFVAVVNKIFKQLKQQ